MAYRWRSTWSNLKINEFTQGKEKLNFLIDAYKATISSSKNLEVQMDNMLKFSHIEFLKIFKQKDISSRLNEIVCLPYEEVNISGVDQAKVFKNVAAWLSTLSSEEESKNNEMMINYLSITSSHPCKIMTRTRENPLKQNFSASTGKTKSKWTNISVVGKEKKDPFISPPQNFSSPGKSWRKSIKTNKSNGSNRTNNRPIEDNIYGGVVASTHYKFKK